MLFSLKDLASMMNLDVRPSLFGTRKHGMMSAGPRACSIVPLLHKVENDLKRVSLREMRPCR